MSKQNPTIMVVEDENLLLQAITKKLKLSGMDVLSCASGKQALDYLGSLDELPDAVWLDYYLKDMNGLAFMQELKQGDQWSHIPVLVVSNSASPDKVNNMLALGAKKYILKAEYRLDEIIAMIREFINDGTMPGVGPSPAASAAAVPIANGGLAKATSSYDPTITPASNEDSPLVRPTSKAAPISSVGSTSDRSTPSIESPTT